MRGIPVDHIGNAPSDLPPVGRREFFGLLSWRLAEISGAAVVVGYLVGPRAVALGANTCVGKTDNHCTTTLNQCTPSLGKNTCGSAKTGGSNLCNATTGGGNSCRSPGVTGTYNTCIGGPGGTVGNQCVGTNGNFCNPGSTNSCSATGATAGNSCSGFQANVCSVSNTCAGNCCSPSCSDYTQPTC